MGKKSTQQHYNLWADGSAFSYGRYMGAGWVLYKGDQKIEARSEPILKPTKGSSTLAEINAALLGLASIPKNASVTLHSDCMDVLNYLKTRTIATHSQGKSKYRESTLEAVTELFNIAAKFKDLELIKCNDKTDMRLAEAHGLAQEGALKAKSLAHLKKNKFH